VEEACIYSKHSQIHESLVATSTPNKMGLALHCHGEHKITKWKWKKMKIQGGRRDCSHKS